MLCLSQGSGFTSAGSSPLPSRERADAEGDRVRGLFAGVSHGRESDAPWHESLSPRLGTSGGRPNAWSTQGNGATEAPLGFRNSCARSAQTAFSSCFAIGSERIRFFVSAYSALATAGPIGGTPGSPTPVGSAEDGTICTSTLGISFMRSGR